MRWRPCSDRRTYGDDDLRQGGHARIGSFGLSSKTADRADLSLSGLAELLHYDQTYLDRVAAELNNRPRRIVGYRTPQKSSPTSWPVPLLPPADTADAAKQIGCPMEPV